MDKAEHYLSDGNIIGFPKLGIEFKIDSTAVSIFGFDIKWYGVIIAFGMLLAMIYCFKRMKEFGLDSDRVIDVVLLGLIGAIVGARSYYIAFSSELTFADFLKIRDGGLAIYGGLIGALLVGGIVAKVRKVKLFPLLDIASLGFLIGQGIGRWGNFVNKEAFGAETTLPWGMASKSIENTLGYGADGIAVLAHPCFLYESLWCLIGFVLLHFYSKKRKFDGEVFLMYSAWYGLGRFFIEGLRTDSLYLGRLRVSQLVAAVCVVVAIGFLLVVRSNIKHGAEVVLYRDTEESKKLLLEAEERAAKEAERKKGKKESTGETAAESFEASNGQSEEQPEELPESNGEINSEPEKEIAEEEKENG